MVRAAVRRPSPSSTATARWPSSSGTAEDRNHGIGEDGMRLPAGGRRPPGRRRIATAPRPATRCSAPRVAVVLRDGGGSQPRLRAAPAAGRPEWPSSSGTAEDRNFPAVRLVHQISECGRRPPGRRRIATAPAAGTRSATSSGRRPPGRRRIATQLVPYRRNATVGGRRPPGRRRIATTSVASASSRAPPWWPSSSGTAEDRNSALLHVADSLAGGGRRPPGRRRIATLCGVGQRRRSAAVAVVLRDGGGSQPLTGVGTQPPTPVAVVLRDGGGSQPWHRRVPAA